MKAWVLDGINEFHLKEINKPQPEKGEVLVAVKAAGICGSDIPRIYKTGTYHYPLIPGHEFSGQVVELGGGVDENWLNKPVGVFPLIPCGNCEPCQKGKYELCRQYGYIGSRQNGAFAEYVVVPAKNLIELPAGVSYKAAAMLEPLSVAVHAARRSGLLENRSIDVPIVVCGLGTIGMLLLAVLKCAGFKCVLAIGNKKLQHDKAVQMGLLEEHYCDSKTIDSYDWIMKKTGDGAKVFFECVGKGDTIKLAINSAAPEARVVMVGNPVADISMERELYWKILRNQLSVIGSWNSSFNGRNDDDWHYALEVVKKGKIKLKEIVTHEYSIDEMETGLFLMRDKGEDYLKVMSII